MIYYSPSRKKACSKCKTEYFPSENQLKRSAYICAACNAKRSLAWKNKNREKVRAQERARYAKISAEKMRDDEDWERVITIIPASIAPKVQVQCNSIWNWN